MACVILKKIPNITLEKASEIYENTIQKYILKQKDVKHKLDFFLFNFLSNINISSQKIEKDHSLTEEQSLINSKNCILFSRMQIIDAWMLIKASAILAAVQIFT